MGFGSLNLVGIVEAGSFGQKPVGQGVLTTFRMAALDTARPVEVSTFRKFSEEDFAQIEGQVAIVKACEMSYENGYLNARANGDIVPGTPEAIMASVEAARGREAQRQARREATNNAAASAPAPAPARTAPARAAAPAAATPAAAPASGQRSGYRNYRG